MKLRSRDSVTDFGPLRRMSISVTFFSEKESCAPALRTDEQRPTVRRVLTLDLKSDRLLM